MLGGEAVPYKSSVKILDMQLDEHMNWRQHCEHMAAKTRAALAVTRRASRHLWASDRTRLIQALALPYVRYNQEVFEAAPESAKVKLKRAYHACARTAEGTNSQPGEHGQHGQTDEALDKMEWPTYAAQHKHAQTKVA